MRNIIEQYKAPIYFLASLFWQFSYNLKLIVCFYCSFQTSVLKEIASALMATAASLIGGQPSRATLATAAALKDLFHVFWLLCKAKTLQRFYELYLATQASNADILWSTKSRTDNVQGRLSPEKRRRLVSIHNIGSMFAHRLGLSFWVCPLMKLNIVRVGLHSNPVAEMFGFSISLAYANWAYFSANISINTIMLKSLNPIRKS